MGVGSVFGGESGRPRSFLLFREQSCELVLHLPHAPEVAINHDFHFDRIIVKFVTDALDASDDRLDLLSGQGVEIFAMAHITPIGILPTSPNFLAMAFIGR